MYQYWYNDIKKEMLQFIYWQALDCPRSCSETHTAIPSLTSTSCPGELLQDPWVTGGWRATGSCGREQIHSLENSQAPQWQHSPGFGLISGLGDAKEVRASSRCCQGTKSGERCSYSPLNDEIIQFLAPQTLTCQTRALTVTAEMLKFSKCWGLHKYPQRNTLSTGRETQTVPGTSD